MWFFWKTSCPFCTEIVSIGFYLELESDFTAYLVPSLKDVKESARFFPSRTWSESELSWEVWSKRHWHLSKWLTLGERSKCMCEYCRGHRFTFRITIVELSFQVISVHIPVSSIVNTVRMLANRTQSKLSCITFYVKPHHKSFQSQVDIRHRIKCSL